MIQINPFLWTLQSDLYATNSGVWISAGQACLIDPGITSEELAGIADFLEEQRVTPHAIVITHGHWDHMLGPERFPGVNVITHVKYLETLEQHGEHLQQQIENWENDAGIQRKVPFVLPRPKYAFNTSMRIFIGELMLDLLHTPGHAPDHISIYHAGSGTLWAGDMLSDMEIPMIMESLHAYEQTLAKLAGLDVQVLIPGHGTPTTDTVEIHKRFEGNRAYLAELRGRVSHAVKTGMSRDEALAYCEDIPWLLLVLR